MPPIVEFEVFRDHLGVAADSADADAASRLLDAICAEVRRMSRRDLEGDEGGSYDQVVRIRGAQEFTLPHVPVRAVTSIRRVYFDGDEDDPYEATDWRLDDAARGLVRLVPGATTRSRFLLEHGRRGLLGGPDYVRVVWTTTGDIPADLPQAVLEWGKARWDDADARQALTGYKTGDDAETYDTALLGQPPRSLMRAVMGARHAHGGGVV